MPTSSHSTYQRLNKSDNMECQNFHKHRVLWPESIGFIIPWCKQGIIDISIGIISIIPWCKQQCFKSCLFNFYCCEMGTGPTKNGHLSNLLTTEFLDCELTFCQTLKRLWFLRFHFWHFQKKFFLIFFQQHHVL